ncbi:MAG: polyphosphate polymerase domain-containing protein [Eubacteriales bacterium]|nr:polyphosphate polymerase domain-containing protein [Eubacteriales bacterium]
MEHAQTIFKRYEIKYLLNREQYRKIRDYMQEYMEPDCYGRTSIYNIYFDTPDYCLIRESLEKPVYKEKLRLRSYGMDKNEGHVFVELKKKYDGIVYKRREEMEFEEAREYLYDGRHPETDSQILREIDWFLKYHKNLEPKMYIAYDRIALADRDGSGLRITFDKNIRWRNFKLDLQEADSGRQIIEDGYYLMEVKTPDSLPLWMTGILDKLELFPVSFSKYGRAYQDMKGLAGHGAVI